jgi:hypothetical protein
MQRTYHLFIKYTMRKNAHARFSNLLTNLGEVYPHDFKGFVNFRLEIAQTDEFKNTHTQVLLLASITFCISNYQAVKG